jgi:hypothetical protein
MAADASEKFIAGYAALADFLTGAGFPTSVSTITKYCSPKINIGPPKEGYWGIKPLFSPNRALEWARSRSGINNHAA